MSENLKELAETILKEYDLAVDKIAFYAQETSVIYKVTDKGEREYALKIFDNASSNIEDNMIEVFIYDAIQKDASFPFIEILPNKRNESITEHYDSEGLKSWRCFLTSWLESKDLKGRETAERFVDLGKIVGELHRILGQATMPESLKPKKWDQVFYFREEQILYTREEFRHLFSLTEIEILNQTIHFLDGKLKDLYSVEGPQLLHGDINPWNVRIVGKQLSILDFEDAIYGPRIQDLAILFYYYLDHPEYQFKDIQSWIIAGYNSTGMAIQIDDADFDMLYAARRINLMNFALGQGEEHSAFIKGSIERIKAFHSSFLLE